jgi:hypothetical protein
MSLLSTENVTYKSITIGHGGVQRLWNEELNRCAVDFAKYLFFSPSNLSPLDSIRIFYLLLIESNLHTIFFANPSA